MATKKFQKSSEFFSCTVCDFNASRQSQYERHLLTRKHILATNSNKKVPKNAEEPLSCHCGKSYKDRTGLWRHKKKCNQLQVVNDNDMLKSLKIIQEQQNELLEQIQTQQAELKWKDVSMEEMIDKMSITSITNNNTNNFNINVFLNERCKNAINLSEFIERIEVSHDDLENNAQLGFVKGITKIFMDNLKKLTIHERPIHCTDVKRDTIYIKDQNNWERDRSSEMLSDAIQEVSRKSLKSLIEWKQNNPEYDNMDSYFSKKCIVIQLNSSAITKKDSHYPKIIHNIAKENVIIK